MTDIRHIFGRSQKTIDEEKQKTIDEEDSEDEDCYTCDKCGCKTDETRYLPSIEDEKLESCCGEEYCMKCWDCGDLDKYKFIEEMSIE